MKLKKLLQELVFDLLLKLQLTMKKMRMQMTRSLLKMEKMNSFLIHHNLVMLWEDQLGMKGLPCQDKCALRMKNLLGGIQTEKRIFMVHQLLLQVQIVMTLRQLLHLQTLPSLHLHLQFCWLNHPHVVHLQECNKWIIQILLIPLLRVSLQRRCSVEPLASLVSDASTVISSHMFKAFKMSPTWLMPH